MTNNIQELLQNQIDNIFRKQSIFITDEKRSSTATTAICCSDNFDIAAILVIPIGQMLFICTPSAAGLGLLLVVSIFPILVNLGVSRPTAVSVISACTIFDMGPGSANTARSAELAGMTNMEYFVEHQLSLVIPVTIFLMVVYYFSNRYFDRIDRAKGVIINEKMDVKTIKVGVMDIW